MKNSKGSPFISDSKDVTEWYVLFYGEYILYKSNGTCEEVNDKAIIKGKESVQKCSYEQEYISIKVNGKKVELNQFMAKLYQSMLRGMLAPLKDIGPLDKAAIDIKANLSDSDQ